MEQGFGLHICTSTRVPGPTVCEAVLILLQCIGAERERYGDENEENGVIKSAGAIKRIIEVDEQLVNPKWEPIQGQSVHDSGLLHV